MTIEAFLKYLGIADCVHSFYPTDYRIASLQEISLVIGGNDAPAVAISQ
jgi:hypothetical protein